MRLFKFLKFLYFYDISQPIRLATYHYAKWAKRELHSLEKLNKAKYYNKLSKIYDIIFNTLSFESLNKSVDELKEEFIQNFKDKYLN